MVNIKSQSFVLFTNKLCGWKTSHDGEIYCPACWKRYLGMLRAKCHREGCIFDEGEYKDCRPAAQVDIAEVQRCREGWFAQCANLECQSNVFVPD